MNAPDVNPQEQTIQKKRLDLRIFGVGLAGCKIVGKISQLGFAGVRTIALDTDAPALEQYETREKYLIGAATTRGMGTGGDPERGRAAAAESAEQIRTLCKDADIIFIVAGFGRGTGTGATPVLASYAKESGALVLCIVTLPFDFEAGRCMRQAFMGLRYLNQIADGVISVSNNSFSKLASTSVKHYEYLKLVNNYLAEGICSLFKLLSYQGEMNTSFADLCSMLKGKHARSAIATVSAAGENRAHRICEKLLQHPMLESGNALANAESVLVNFSSNGDVTTEEIRIVMDFIKRNAKKAFFKVGESVVKQDDGQLSLTVLTAASSESSQQLYLDGKAEYKDTSSSGMSKEYFLKDEENQTTPSNAASQITPPPPTISSEQIPSIMNSQQNISSPFQTSKLIQGMFEFEISSANRFSKTHPTIHEGENLDVPTFYRRGIKLN